MNDREPWYMGERAQSLAILALTDHPEVSVIPQNNTDAGVSILATLREAGKPVGRLFGVEVRAMLSGDLGGARSMSLDKDSQLHYRDVPFPVCLFLFTVDNGWGYWGWMQQPVFSSGGVATLQRNEVITLRALEKSGVSEIVQVVTHWYDKRNHHSNGHDVGVVGTAGALV